MKSILLRSLLPVIAASALAPLASLHATTVLPAVGPTPPGAYDKVEVGYLTVFSRTEQTQWGENTYYNVHTPYWIYDASGKRIRTVANHDTSIDEDPQRVELAPGKYFVKAWSDNDGLVTVPVVVKLARTTTVNLEEGRGQAHADDSRAVKTPTGDVVGWKA